MRYLLGLIFFSGLLYGFNYHLKPYKISEGIHCFFGLPSEINRFNGGNMINSCYIETSEGYVVIDSGPTYSYAQEAYATMRKIKNLPVRYVINTSTDEVHVLGNEFYKEVGATLIGPKGYKEDLEAKTDLFLSKKLSKDAMINTRVIPLDEYVNEKRLKLDGIEILIKALEHDDKHLYVYIEAKEILFAGDLIFNNRMVPINNGRSVVNWLKSLEEISELKWVDIISSHGYMTRRTALNLTKSYLTLLTNEVNQSVRAEESIDETLEKVTMSQFSNYKFYEEWQRRNVETVYDELEEIYDFEDEEKKEVAVKKNKIVKTVKTVKKLKKKEKPKVKKKISLRYRTFNQAMALAKKEDKIVLIKVRSTVCKYCDQLERIISKNRKVKKILRQYFELVKVNVDYEDVPMGLYVRSTPTLIFVRADNSKVLMHLTGIRALGELLDILNEAVEDGHNGAYLRR